jgi:hypothetical protein
MAVPLSAVDTFPPLVVKVRLAVALPVEVGVADTVQDAEPPAAMVVEVEAGLTENEEALLPPTTYLLTVSAEPPLLEIVTVEVGALPSRNDPKATVDGAMFATAELPVPVRATD